MTEYTRSWAIGASRDERIDGSPGRGFTARFTERHVTYQCVKPACTADVDGAALYCAMHLWTFDNPVLASAPLVFPA